MATVLVLVIAVGSVAWYLSREWKPLLDQHLKDMVLASTDSLYRVEYDNFDLNLVTGTASISNFRLIPDSLVYEKLVRRQEAPDNVYELSVDAVVLRNFHPKLLYSEKKLNITKIIIDNPSLRIVNRRQPYNDTVPDHPAKPRTLYQVISKVFKEVKVGDILLKDINFTFVNRSNQPTKQTSLRNLNIVISDILIDSLSEQDPNRLYHTRNVNLLMADYRMATPDSLYYVKFKGISFSTSGRTLSLEKMSMEPRYPIAEFYRKVGQRKDRFNMVFNSVLLRGIDLHRFSREQKLYANSFNLKNALVEIYNTNAYPNGKKVAKYGKFPHQQLQRLALDLKIDTFNIRNTAISYSEFSKVSRQTGKVTLDRTSGRIYNFTNDSVALSRNHLMKAYFTSYLMNKGRLDIRFTFDLTDRLGAFSYNGTLGAMDGRAINKITRPLGMIEINSADIKKMSFEATANEVSANGKLRFYYNHLNVKVLSRDKQTGEVKKQGLVSTVANLFVIHSDNPNKKGDFTEGTIRYVRPSNASFFAVLWQSLFSGIKGGVGVSADKETRIKSTVAKVTSVIGGIKEKLAERKERREQRKKERQVEKELKKRQKELEEQQKAKKDT